jgi:drug/metabolite transporter (DMT)-like permease
MKSEQSYKGHLTMFVVNIIFGMNTPISKSVLTNTLTPYSLYFLRIAGAASLFWIASVFIKENKVGARDLTMLFLAGMLGVAINQFSFVKGLSMTSPINAAIIITLTPIITMILAAVYQKEPITRKKVAGVLIGACGALLLILTSMQMVNNAGSTTGNILCLLSALSYAFYLTAFKKLINRHSPVTLMKWMFLFSTIISLPVCLEDIEKISWQVIPAGSYLRIGYVVVLATFITYMLIPVGQKLLRPTTLSMYNYLQPLIAALAAMAMGLDHFGWNTALAAVLVFCGVYIVTQSKSRAQLLEEEELKEEESKTIRK